MSIDHHQHVVYTCDACGATEKVEGRACAESRRVNPCFIIEVTLPCLTFKNCQDGVIRYSVSQGRRIDMCSDCAMKIDEVVKLVVGEVGGT